MTDFTPIFPRSISGGDYRIPLDHPDTEAVAARADGTYRILPLSETERAKLIACYVELKAASALLWGVIGEQQIEDNGLRPACIQPSFHEKTFGDKAKVGDNVARAVGFVFRCSDYLQRLEDHYGAIACSFRSDVRPNEAEFFNGSVSTFIDDDIPEPGDDI